jgi:hypothetical protein
VHITAERGQWCLHVYVNNKTRLIWVWAKHGFEMVLAKFWNRSNSSLRDRFGRFRSAAKQKALRRLRPGIFHSSKGPRGPRPWEDTTFPVLGRRIVDFAYMAKEMFCKVCKAELHLQDITQERRRNGLCSYLEVKCRKCASSTLVTTDHPAETKARHSYFGVNKKFAIGIFYFSSKLFTRLKILSHFSKVFFLEESLFKRLRFCLPV